MSRIIVASIRVAQQKSIATGGLAVAIECMLNAHQQEGIWLGWSGEQCAQPCTELHVEHRDHYSTMTFSLTPEQHQQFYCGYANNCLWPAFHQRIDLMTFNSHEYQQYLAVNEQIAHYLSTVLRPDDIVWVQDYHLIPLAHYCRKLGLNQPIGFFLHTPFPNPDALATIPRHQSWLPYLLDYEVVGLQSTPDFLNLSNSLTKVLGLSANEGRITYKNRTTLIKSYPISIAPELIQSMATMPTPFGSDTSDYPILGDGQLIVSADRLDYSKGLPKRFESFNTLLEHFPTLKESVNYLQIAPSTREGIESYQQQQNELESLAGQINGKHASFNWVPLIYLNRAVAPVMLMSIFRKAHVGFIAPLRDGMNLVAKEYVAAQDAADPGVLVLSEFTGAASEFQEGALLVNPYDTEATAQALYRALTMSLAERQARHQALMAHLEEFDLKRWCFSFLSDLNAVLETEATPSLQN